MLGNLKKILLATGCLTLSACGGSALGPSFAVGPTTPTSTSGNVAPTDIALNDLSVSENSTGGTTSEVGLLTVTDADAGDTYSITIDDSRFEYNPTTGAINLVAGQSLDYEAAPTILLTITATDAAGATYSEQFTILVENVYEMVAADSTTYRTSSVVLEVVDHDEYNDTSIYTRVAPDAISDRVAASESNPSHVNSNGNATVHYDTSDNSFSLTINQGQTNFYHNFLESELDATVTDLLSYNSILGNMLYEMEISKPGVASRGHAALNYMSYGMWSARAYPTPVAGSRTAYGGIAFGDETNDEDMPTSGFASYTGGTVGQMDIHRDGEIFDQEAYDEAAFKAAAAGNPVPDVTTFYTEIEFHDEYALTGNVSIDINFTANSLRAEFNNMTVSAVNGAPIYGGPSLDFHSSLSLTPGSNSFSGTTSTNNPWLHGTIMGTFYGPNTTGSPDEVGGIWSLFDAGGQDVRAVGSFGASKDP